MSDLLKGLMGGGWAGIYAWVFPSALVIGIFWLVVYPQVGGPIHQFDALSSAEKSGVFLAAALAVGLTLSGLSTPLYRVLEGYSWPRFLREYGIRRQRTIKLKLEQPATDVGWLLGLRYERLARFPANSNQIAPTQLGNALRAFETYGKTRFNLDSQTMWAELSTIVPKYLQTELDRSRAIVDFFVALFFLSTIFGCVTIIFAFVEYRLALLFVGLCGLLSTAAWYRMAVVSSSYWALTVQALVNLGRLKLASEMGLRMPDTFDDEKIMWGLVTKFVYFGDERYAHALDKFRQITASDPSKPSDAKSSLISKPVDNEDDPEGEGQKI